jgi:regulator of sirC expression with transglutaminase-like and TPR domain
MSELPDSSDPEACARYLREIGASGSPVLPLGEAALALAAFERPRVGFARYLQHLAAIARDVGRHAAAAADLKTRAQALNEIILLKYGYSGDELTYDDLQNANLMRVVDRRKGLPVALGILYLHAARAQGWDSVGLGFPGHFLIRLAEGPERLILDPFHGGQVCEAADLRDLLKAMAGQEIELQNNVKSRLLQAGRYERALGVVDTMLMLAPDNIELWQEAGLLHAREGNIRAAMNALQEYVARAPDGTARHQAATVLQQLKAKLN